LDLVLGENMPMSMDEWADCLARIAGLQQNVLSLMTNAAQTEVAKRIDTRGDITNIIECNRSIIISSSSINAMSNWDLIANILDSHVLLGISMYHALHVLQLSTKTQSL